MKKIFINVVNNGFEVQFMGFTLKEGDYVYRSDEELKMLTEVGQVVSGKRISVEEK